MLSERMGGPSLGGLFAGSTPGFDLGLGLAEPGENGSGRVIQAQAPAPPKGPAKDPGKPLDPTLPLGWRRTYRGPPKDPTTYGYGQEHTFYAARGGLAKAVNERGEPSRGALSRVKRKGAAR